MSDIKKLQDMANILRRDSLISTSSAGSGHPTSCLSCAELISCLFFSEMSYNPLDSENPDNDEFILSKGHAAPILYSALYRVGAIKENLRNLRKFTSPLEGHPMPRSLPWIKVATGSLGQGPSIALGFSLAAKMQKRNFRTYVLLGDSELSEGSIYEALQLASYYKLNNLCLIADINRLGQRGETMLGHNIKEYEKRFKSFGFSVLKIDGHNIKQILKALEKAKASKQPSIILAKTFKGQGISFLKNKEGWHGKVLNQEQLAKALEEIPNPDIPIIEIKYPKESKTKESKIKKYKPLSFKIGEEISTREAYGKTLASLALINSNIIATDGEVSNSTFAEEVKKVKKEQFIEGFIAEQNLIGMSLGLSKKGFSVFASTFSSFLSRAHDQIRMSALSSPNFTICGSHCGVSIGEDGPSQMGLEDIALFRSLPESIIFYPSDAQSTSKILELCLKERGLKYIRTTRPKTPVLYSQKEEFALGDFKTPRQSKNDSVVLIGAGITLHESLKAHDLLKKQKIESAVIDLYCIKPLNVRKLIEFVLSHGSRIVVTEDHYKEGGIGELISSLIANTGIKMKSLAITKIPHSGTSDQLLDIYDISARHIVNAARELMK